ncbi:facilitated trehalose transporter Tret1-like isoform X2 [Sipha flava]|uniref:Facilitated trehalose transporter Tret1-like isoform X2 n=1 Tax=Sipha flava TaxID=143950 RepID=A0A8B8G1B5_9HEMI|nr:facilitated trehalose transporter Tret1-like isoform X2 [Sipha flava]
MQVYKWPSPKRAHFSENKPKRAQISNNKKKHKKYSSLLFMVHPFGCFLSGILQGKLGKKRCMIIANVPSIVGWALLYSAESSTFLCASTLLMGFSTGFGPGSTSSYVGEISEPRLRGSLSSLGSTATRVGTLLTYVLGSFFGWRTVAMLSAICPIVCICLIVIIPESPVWLVAKGKNDKAEKAMCWLRGWVEPEMVRHEFLELIHYNEVSGTRGSKGHVEKKKGLLAKLAEFKEPSVYRPMKLMMALFFVSNVVSLFHTRPFITKIMTNIYIVDNQNELLVILTALTGLGSIIATVSVHRVGKRVLTFTTLSVNIVMLMSLGVYIIATKDNIIEPLPSVSLTLLSCIYFIGACGISCMPWMLLIEIFPNKSRGIATSMCTALAYIILFSLTKSYLSIEIYLSLEYTMILFGCIGLIGLIYFYFSLPETENKTLLEIEEYFATN